MGECALSRLSVTERLILAADAARGIEQLQKIVDKKTNIEIDILSYTGFGWYIFSQASMKGFSFTSNQP